MKKNIPETMLVAEIVFQKLREDYSLQKKISDVMCIRETTVRGWTYRDLHLKVGNYLVAGIIMKHTGLTENEYFKHPRKQKK